MVVALLYIPAKAKALPPEGPLALALLQCMVNGCTSHVPQIRSHCLHDYIVFGAALSAWCVSLWFVSRICGLIPTSVQA